ncbi:hypothetical protein GMDG_04568 [Pseudogymnoascus destructans 20631-21]|uniref:Uncharacterized protein n=2 Tax=Pseudogymnoascus destructans TaxID=655981 RepID=L8GBD8_PSED2|nr:hypothetical protein GMDG_04568 [Pseudogymnoascus destructans 20631-21]
MSDARTPNGDSNISPTMEAINGAIDRLKSKFLPPIPHLLYVPTSDPYRGSRPWETHRNSPFEAYEYDDLQYMTLVTGDNRGVARPRGGWEDEINSRSPYNVSRSRSGTATPQQGERGGAKPRSRITLADYRSGKRVPKPSSESQQPAGESSRDKDNVKVAIKSEPAKAAQNGAVHSSDGRRSGAVKNEDAPRPSDSRLPQSKPAAPQAKDNDRHAPPPKAREQQNTTPKPTSMKQGMSRPLPHKPAESNHAPKRPLEKPEQSQPEKRLKVEPKHTPSGAAKGHQRNTSDPLSRLFGTAPKSKPSNPKQSQPTSVDNTQTTRVDDKKAPERGPASGSKAKDTQSATRVPEMPKLLSPLPEYLTSPTLVSFSSGHGVEKSSNNGRHSPSTMKAESSSAKRKEQSKKTSPFRLPELLPRELPPNVEELLAKSKQPPTRKLDTVQARHEKSRNPDTPGVARKAPKLSAAEKRRASKASDTSPPEITYEPSRQTVKLKYKKSMTKDIQRILKMKPMPNRAVLELADGIVPEKPAVSKARAAESKRPRPVPDEQPELSIKRAKVPAKIDSDKAATGQLLPPFKSPGQPPTSGKKLPSASKVTPKKGDAMKSVAMRRVDSADDNTLTPKTGATSTPASMEKPRQNGGDKSAEVDRCRAANMKYSEMGKTLKRKRDVYIHSKENQLATLAGAESLLAYLVAFDAFDTQYRKMGRPNTGDNWLSLFPLLQANHDHGKMHLHLDIVILLIGGVATNALLAVHNQRFAKETPSNSPDYLRFRDAMSENIRRSREFWAQYHMACEEVASREPEAVREGGGMAFVCAPGGQALPVKTVKVEAARMLREYVKKHKLEWEMQVDF